MKCLKLYNLRNRSVRKSDFISHIQHIPVGEMDPSGHISFMKLQIGKLCARREREIMECYLGSAETVGIHGGHDEDIGGVEKLSDALVGSLFGDQVGDHAEENMTTDHLVAVDVAHQLHHGHEQVSLTAFHRSAQLHGPQIATLHRFAHRFETGQFRVA